MIDFHVKIDRNKETIKKSSIEDFFRIKPSTIIDVDDDTHDLIFWGDPIIPDGWLNSISNLSVKDIIQSVKGHFYYIFKRKDLQKIFIGNSFLSILPLYYRMDEDSLEVSDNPLNIKDPGGIGSIDKGFILENVLFNYPLFNRSIIKGVSLLPANHFLEISPERSNLKSHFSLADFYVDKPAPWKNSLDQMSDLFIQQVKDYLPDQFYYNALTGGFDGRTLAAAGLGNDREFTAYCFGSDQSTDAKTAKKVSAAAGLKYLNIPLDENYINKHSYQNGLEFILGSSGTATFARSHYLYAFKKLAKDANIVVTGNFGSEIFRTVHVIGALISPNLHKLFILPDYDATVKALENAPEWRLLKRDTFSLEWERLKEDLKTLPVFNPEYATLTKNEQFYLFVFGEIFRKYFGAEMINQYKHIINRTPFLDFAFFKALLKTALSGAYSGFFTHNPLKRFKGQVLYSHIIRKTFPMFLDIKMDKGYRPADLLSINGSFRIARAFYKRKLRGSKNMFGSDPYAVNSAFIHNMQVWKSLKPNETLFNPELMISSIDNFQATRDSLFTALSQAWYINHLLNDND